MGNADESDVQRTCLACGYNLFGLGDEPRCPECGLRNIPQGYRQQVWDLVDSGRWFLSPFFVPFRKRPPGWWWALDRAGDLKRSYRTAARNFLVAMAMILSTCTIADAIRLEVTRHLFSFERGRATDVPVGEASWVWTFGLGGSIREFDGKPLTLDLYGSTRTIKVSQTTRIVFDPSTGSIPYAVAICSWLILIWACPALIGLWTQIRRGLPEFAHPPHTIRAAANYETHRLLLASVLVVACLAMELAMRLIQFPTNNPTIYRAALFSLKIVVGAYAAAGWIGPIRSDYTRRLVRSKLHGIRIVFMYAILFPAAIFFAVAGLVATMTDTVPDWIYWTV